MIAVIDYGMGNHGSIINMLKKVGASANLTNEPKQLMSAAAVILPGVGHFDRGMKNLHESGLFDTLNRLFEKSEIPILGICLGMQLFTKNSEEGNLPGLGWIDAETKKFRFDENIGRLKIPHMGWNMVRPVRETRLFPVNEELRFYHVHSYHVCCKEENVLTKTEYGYEFVSGITHSKLVGVQFHPEKSHRFGIAFFRRFCREFGIEVRVSH